MYRCCTLVVVVVVCFVPAYSSSSFLDSAVRPLLHAWRRKETRPPRLSSALLFPPRPVSEVADN